MKYCEDKVTEFSLVKITDIAPNLATNVNVFNRDELGERIRLAGKIWGKENRE